MCGACVLSMPAVVFSVPEMQLCHAHWHGFQLLAKAVCVGICMTIGTCPIAQACTLTLSCKPHLVREAINRLTVPIKGTMCAERSYSMSYRAGICMETCRARSGGHRLPWHSLRR